MIIKNQKQAAVLPCHRVISSSGAVGGYSGSGGIEMKKYLLLLEGYISVY
jgi:O6-methylguanine-DNA--protein-cysteine methyltransferase